MNRTLDQFLVTDKVAIVTGAGRGIGAASALALAEAGADVVLSARSTDQLEAVAEQVRGAGRRAVVVPADLSDLDRLDDLIAAATGELGRLDIVVNNVGGAMPQPLLDTSDADFEQAFHFNVTTAFSLTRRAAHVLAATEGSVINIASLIGRVRDRGYAAYGTAKAAMLHMTRLVAADLAPKVRVNAIGVGSTATSALEIVVQNDALRTEMESKTPLKRLGTPEDIALGVLYLASPAGAFVTGKVLEIDGGLEASNLDMGIPDIS
jgi:7-alpha-hydroxysteroid dehydrogenase